MAAKEPTAQEVAFAQNKAKLQYFKNTTVVPAIFSRISSACHCVLLLCFRGRRMSSSVRSMRDRRSSNASLSAPLFALMVRREQETWGMSCQWLCICTRVKIGAIATFLFHTDYLCWSTLHKVTHLMQQHIKLKFETVTGQEDSKSPTGHQRQLQPHLDGFLSIPHLFLMYIFKPFWTYYMLKIH